MWTMKKEEIRDLIIFGDDNSEYINGVRYFKKLRRREIRKLLDKKIFDPIPWTLYMEYIWFMEKYGDDDMLFLHGFVYSPYRNDYPKRQGGIVIEGIGRDRAWDDKNCDEIKVFTFLFKDADQFSIDPPWVYYD